MKDIFYIVRDEIVNKMDPVVKVESFAGGVLTVCGPKWARIGKVATDGAGNEFNITDIDYDARTITVTPKTGPAFAGTTLILVLPTFIIGTRKATRTEWENLSDDEANKVPFIWLVEPTVERPRPEGSPIQRESDLRLYYLDSNNASDWRTEEIHAKRTQPLYNMMTEFNLAAKKNILFEPIAPHNVRNLTKFGTEDAEGFEKQILDANLTGIEQRPTLVIRKMNCVC